MIDRIQINATSWDKFTDPDFHIEKCFLGRLAGVDGSPLNRVEVKVSLTEETSLYAMSPGGRGTAHVGDFRRLTGQVVPEMFVQILCTKGSASDVERRFMAAATLGLGYFPIWINAKTVSGELEDNRSVMTLTRVSYQQYIDLNERLPQDNMIFGHRE
jgi:hypothetical protein